MQKIKKENGITMIALIATLSVLMIIFGVTIYSSKKSFEIKDLTNLYSDVEILEDRAKVYYAQHEEFPIIKPEETATIDGHEVYKIDFGKINNINGLHYTDYYIDITTGRVYLSGGKTYANSTYYTKTEQEYQVEALEIPFYIRYNLDGGTLSAENPTLYYTSSETFTLNNPTKEGYAFLGWTGSNGETPQRTVKIEQGSTEDRTYTANWGSNILTISLDSQEADTAGTAFIYETYNLNFKLPNGSEMTATQNGIIKPTKNNLYFCGYYTEEDGKGVRYIDANGYLTSDASNTHFIQNGTLYACWEKIPDEYQEVEYIESTGTQYIDTGFCPNQDTEWVVDANIKYESGCHVMGCRTYTLKFYFAKVCSYTNNNFAIAYGTKETESTSSSYPYRYLYDSRHTFDFNKNNLYVDGNLLLQTSQSSGFSIPYSIYIFAMHDAYTGTPTATCYTDAKLYSSQIYDNGTLVRDFVPCYAKTSVTNVEGTTCPAGTRGLYDKVNNKFYTNKGTGTFNKGSDV